jgi:hypothetical protein
MKIEPFVPFNHLLKAVKVSPTYVEQGDVSVTMDSLKEAMNVPNIIKYRIEIPSADAEVLSSTPYLLEGLSGSFAIISGLAYLSIDASDSLTGIGSISINDGANIYFKSSSVSNLDPGKIAFISSAAAYTNIPQKAGDLYVATNTDSSTTPGGPLVIILYLIDFSADL